MAVIAAADLGRTAGIPVSAAAAGDPGDTESSIPSEETGDRVGPKRRAIALAMARGSAANSEGTPPADPDSAEPPGIAGAGTVEAVAAEGESAERGVTPGSAAGSVERRTVVPLPAGVTDTDAPDESDVEDRADEDEADPAADAGAEATAGSAERATATDSAAETDPVGAAETMAVVGSGDASGAAGTRTDGIGVDAAGRAQDRRKLDADGVASACAARVGAAAPLTIVEAAPGRVTLVPVAVRRTEFEFAASRAAAPSTARRRATQANGPRAGAPPRDRPRSGAAEPNAPEPPPVAGAPPDARPVVVELVAPRALLEARGTAAVRRISPSPTGVPGGPTAPRPVDPDPERPVAPIVGGAARGATSFVAAPVIGPAALTSGKRRTGTVLPVIPAAIPPGT
ncbi:hypothetical protein [Nakamurella panacisegetis]|uniref:hypothetical protein n=1 Tax=Nakamurella panacisegetis TaxID=1090615 RepID=UPI0012FDFC18|nr:hypothetical protein [Nakamurella panacisegetis]